MSSTFKFHSQVNETVPWQAQYSFPTQATSCSKQIVKLPPKNGSTFAPGNIIRIEFPADNYLNVLNSVLSFDLALTGASAKKRLQRSGAHSVIKRLRVMYGSLVLEDIQEYKTLVRIFTEAGVQNDFLSTTGSVLDGVYTTVSRDNTVNKSSGTVGSTETSNAMRSGTALELRDDLLANVIVPAGYYAEYSYADPRTFCLNLMSGILTCKKLIPLKWMAAQLAIEITLADATDCIITSDQTGASYSLTNVNYIAEMLEFDSTYDSAFFQGLVSGGVPLKFASWHYHSFNMSGSTVLAQIHERSRSVKAALAVVRSTDTATLAIDTDRFWHAAGATWNTTTGQITGPTVGAITQFQFRVGGRYYPAQPVRCELGGAEAMVELLKTFDALGDYTRASTIGNYEFTSYGTGNVSAGSKFIMASEFENTDVMPDSIAGINAEEQSDIALSILCNGTPNAKRVDVFMFYDAMLVVREGNVVDLIM